MTDVAHDAEATLAALRERGDQTVDRLLRENEPHWRSLSETDRLTVEALARTIASRLLDRPARRLATESGAADHAAYARALSQLFAVDGADDYAARRSTAFEPRSG
jgi:glutamyl-tRNA reductase